MKNCILFLILIVSGLSAIGQGIVVDSLGVAVNENKTSADPSAILDVSSDTKGLLIPRVSTTEMQSIQSPAEGLIVYNTTDHAFMYYQDRAWRVMAKLSDIPAGDNLGDHTATENIRLDGNFLSNDSEDRGLYIENTGNIKTTNNLYIGTTLSSSSDLYIADRIIDWDASTYYLDPSSTSIMNYVRANRFYDKGNTAYYVDPASTSVMSYVRANRFYDQGNTSYYVDPASTSVMNYVNGSQFVDRDNTSFYCDPDTVSKLNSLMIGSTEEPTVSLEIKMPIDDARPVLRAGDASGRQFTFVPENCGWGYNNLGRDGDYALVWKQPKGSNAGLMIGPHASTYNAFYFSGDGAFSIKTVDSQGYNFYVNGSAGGTYNWNVNSDARLKQNVQEIDSALNIVTNLRGVYFEWKEDSVLQRPSGRQVGFIAQELKNYLPEVVADTTQRNPYYTVSYSTLTPVLAEAIKQLKEQKDAEIGSLEAEIEALRSLVESMQETIEALQNDN